MWKLGRLRLDEVLPLRRVVRKKAEAFEHFERFVIHLGNHWGVGKQKINTVQYELTLSLSLSLSLSSTGREANLFRKRKIFFPSYLKGHPTLSKGQ